MMPQGPWGPWGPLVEGPGAGAPGASGALQERALKLGPLGPDPVSGFHKKKVELFSSESSQKLYQTTAELPFG